jgi:hypothetical protein
MKHARLWQMNTAYASFLIRIWKDEGKTPAQDLCYEVKEVLSNRTMSQQEVKNLIAMLQRLVNQAEISEPENR